MPTAAQTEDGREVEINPLRPSPSTISRVSSTLSSMSHVSLVKSRQAVHAVGSYLGLTNTGSHLDLWRDRLAERAQDGSVGLHLPRWDHPSAVRESLARLNAAMGRSERVLLRCSEDEVFQGGALGLGSATSLLNPGLTTTLDDLPGHAGGDDNDVEGALGHPGEDGRGRVQETESESVLVDAGRDGADMQGAGHLESVHVDEPGPREPALDGRHSSTSTSLSEDDVAVFFTNSEAHLAEVGRKLSEGEIILHEDFDDSAMADCSALTDQEHDLAGRERASTTSSEFSVIEHELFNNRLPGHMAESAKQHVWDYELETSSHPVMTLPVDDLVAHTDNSDDGSYMPMGGRMSSLSDGNEDPESGDLYAVCSTPISREGLIQAEALPVKEVLEIPNPEQRHELSSTMKTVAPPFPLLSTGLLQQHTYSDTVMMKKSPRRTSEQPMPRQSTISHEGQSGVKHRHSVTFNPMVTEVLDKEHTTSSFLRETTAENCSADLVRHPLQPGEAVLYRSEALEHYRQYVEIETERKEQFLMERHEELNQQLDEGKKQITEALELAQGYYYGSTEQHQTTPMQKLRNTFRRSKGAAARRPRDLVKLHGRANLNVQRQLEELPVYTPWLIYIIIAVQVLVSAICSALNGVSVMGLEPDMQLRSGVLTFRGRETVEHWVRPNIWIGPTVGALIHYGAVFAPCMRADAGILLESSLRGLQADPLLGCCEVASRNTAGTTTMEECFQLTAGVGVWREGVPCGEREWTLGQVSHILRPCCYGHQGMCKLTTQSHCAFLTGTFHAEVAEHCTQVNCLSLTCGMGGLPADKTQPYLPQSPNQQWRLLTAPFLHQGVLYLVLVVVLEASLGRQIEVLAGPARLALIFFYSGVISLVLGAVFSPYVSHCGAGGATFSLVGILIVELCQSWQLVAHPWRETAKLGSVVLLFLASGTLPYVDNFELLGGLLFGMLLSILLLPYVTFGRWHAARRRLLVLGSAPIILMTSVFIFYMFYHVQTLDQACHVCQLMNCVPYTRTMCNMTGLQ